MFSVNEINRPSAVEGRALGAYDYQRFDRINWSSFFKGHPDPPDVLAVRIPSDPKLQSDWETRFLDRPAGKRPKYLVVVERAGDVLRSHSSVYRARVKRFHRAGYEGVLQHVDSSSCGSPTWGSFFATIYYQRSLEIDDDLALKLVGDLELLPRSFENCLKPVGVPRKLWAPKSWRCQETATPQKPNHLGHVRQHPVVDPLGPALLDPDLRVLLPSGIRQLDPEEWIKIKGLPKTWKPGPKAVRGIVESMGAHEWSALGDFITLLEGSRDSEPRTPEPSSPLPLPLAEIPTLIPPVSASSTPWTWEAPNLGPTSAFYHRQAARLREVTAELGGPPEWITDGEAALVSHRENYGPNGPKHLVIL
jgi:hypothetical protein